MNKKTLLTILVLILLAGAIYYWNSSRLPQGSVVEEEIFCTQDAMQCPDGSFVGRVPPTCSFAACPAENATSTPVFEDGTLPETSNMSIEGTASSSLDQDMIPGQPQQ